MASEPTLLQRVLALPKAEQAKLVQDVVRHLEGSDPGTDSEKQLDEYWGAEIDRRIAAADRTGVEYPWRDVIAEARRSNRGN